VQTAYALPTWDSVGLDRSFTVCVDVLLCLGLNIAQPEQSARTSASRQPPRRGSGRAELSPLTFCCCSSAGASRALENESGRRTRSVGGNVLGRDVSVNIAYDADADLKFAQAIVHPREIVDGVLIALDRKIRHADDVVALTQQNIVRGDGFVCERAIRNGGHFSTRNGDSCDSARITSTKSRVIESAARDRGAAQNEVQ
jgi:hypothetical protein